MAPLGIEKGGNREYDDDGFSSYAGSEIGEEYLHPQYVERLRGEGIVDMDCKFGHVAAISDGGDLFTWGVGRHGQLGQGTFIDSEFPTLVETLRNTFVVGVSVGHSHSLCLSDDDTTYAFGFTHRYAMTSIKVNPDLNMMHTQRETGSRDSGEERGSREAQEVLSRSDSYTFAS